MLTSTVNKTSHAEIRTSQRSISNRKLLLVLEHGIIINHKGRTIYYISNTESINLSQGFTNCQEIDKLKNIAVVVDNNEIITAYHPTKRKRKKIFKFYRKS